MNRKEVWWRKKEKGRMDGKKRKRRTEEMGRSVNDNNGRKK